MSSVAVLLGLGALDQQDVCRCVRHWAVPNPLGYHEDFARIENYRRTAFEFDAEGAVPAEEEFVLVVVMPRELAH